jgi:hypothetical protein
MAHRQPRRAAEEIEKARNFAPGKAVEPKADEKYYSLPSCRFTDDGTLLELLDDIGATGLSSTYGKRARASTSPSASMKKLMLLSCSALLLGCLSSCTTVVEKPETTPTTTSMGPMPVEPGPPPPPKGY